MSKIESKMKELKELEKRLELEKLKIEFLGHILESASSYNHDHFKDVKKDVVVMLSQFVSSAIESIENGTELTFNAQSKPSVETPAAQSGVFSKEAETEAKRPSPPPSTELPPNEKLSFALRHRNLATKTVTVANDKGLTIKGKVVGLDAPNVVVQVDDGPMIKVPVNNVSVVS